MSRKDYIAIASCLRACREGEDALVLRVTDTLAYELCHVFAQDNDSFDRERFLSAAGVRT